MKPQSPTLHSVTTTATARYQHTRYYKLIRPRILLRRNVRAGSSLLAFSLPLSTARVSGIVATPGFPRLLVPSLVNTLLVSNSLHIVVLAVLQSERLGEVVAFIGGLLLRPIGVEALPDLLLNRLVGESLDEVFLLDAVPAGAAFFAGAHALDGFGFFVFDDKVDKLAGV